IGRFPPPTSPCAEIVWCGARNGRWVASFPFPRPAALCICVTSSASSNVGGGRMPGSRRASMVFPAPGGPIISRLWPPAAAISSARLASAWPRTSARSRASGGSGGRLRSAMTGSGSQAPRREVGGESLEREVEPRVQEGCPHPLARLAHGRVREAHDREGGQPLAHVDLDGDLAAVHSLKGEGGDAGKHGTT